jgi:hypothetical protein
MSEMIEKVAKAIWENIAPPSWDSLSEGERNLWRRHAISAIAAVEGENSRLREENARLRDGLKKEARHGALAASDRAQYR